MTPGLKRHYQHKATDLDSTVVFFFKAVMNKEKNEQILRWIL